VTDARAPVRVLMLNYEYPPIGGGTGMACRHLLGAFARTPLVQVDLVTSGVDARTPVERPAENIRIHRVPVAKRRLDYWRASELARWTVQAHRVASRLTRRERFDLCHCWGGWPPGVVGYLLRRRLPYLVALRGSDVPHYNPRLEHLDSLVFERISRRVWGRARCVVAVGQQLRELALDVAPGLEIRLIPNGTDTTTFTPGRPDERFTVLFVGRLVSRKRPCDLLTAFSEVVARVPDARLLFVGGGPEDEALREQTRELGLDGAVRFLGQTPYDELPALYRSAHVFVLPSLREGMPNVVLEAMTSGLPIVTTRAGAELLDGNGIEVTAEDPAALARAIVRYAADPRLRIEHGRRSRELAESMSWDSVARWYAELYDELLRSPASVTRQSTELDDEIR
jgi:L-malate glycosyltransferase